MTSVQRADSPANSAGDILAAAAAAAEKASEEKARESSLFLHRCCLQFSPSLANFASKVIAASTASISNNNFISHGPVVPSSTPLPTGEISYALDFIAQHGRNYPKEIGKTLLVRILEADTTLDILGAWYLVSAVMSHPQTDAKLLNWLADHLAAFIRQRWMASAADGGGGAGAGGGPNSVTTFSNPGKRIIVVAPPIRQVQVEPVIAAAYKGIERSWRSLLSSHVFAKLKQAMEYVQKKGNLPAAAAATLITDTKFTNEHIDSLWKLKRLGGPRPQHVLDVMKFCSFDSPAAVPCTEKLLIEKTGPIPGRLREWLMKIKSAHCAKCDSWEHAESKCPCLRPMLRDAAVNGPVKANDGTDGGGPMRRRQDLFDLMSVDEAFRILRKFRLAVPPRPDQVLDLVVENIRKRLPYEDLINALDVACRFRSGEEERHALWIVSSYNFALSKSIFASDWSSLDDNGPGPLGRLKTFFSEHRRFREYSRLADALRLLHKTFAQATLSPEQQAARRSIKDHNAFFFCFFTNNEIGSDYPFRTAELKAFPAIMTLAPLHDRLCQVCLDLHQSQRDTKICPKDSVEAPREPWDLYVSKIVLGEFSLLDVRSDDQVKVDNALADIQANTSLSNDEKLSKLSRTKIALALTQKAKVPYCKACKIFGHMGKRCEKNSEKTLYRFGLKLAEAKLKPYLIDNVIKDQVARKSGDENNNMSLEEISEIDKNIKRLEEAKDALIGKGRGFHPHVLDSIDFFERERIPLKICRFAPSAAEKLLLAVGMGGSVHKLDPFRTGASPRDFPHICIFCSSYAHKSTNCRDSKTQTHKLDDLEKFVDELRRCGCTLEQFCHGTVDQALLNSLPPTSYRGRMFVQALLRQMADDCAPGGYLREKLQPAILSHSGNGRRRSNSRGRGRSRSPVRLTAASQTSLLARKLSRVISADEEELAHKKTHQVTNSPYRSRSRSGSKSRTPRRSRTRTPRKSSRSPSERRRRSSTPNSRRRTRSRTPVGNEDDRPRRRTRSRTPVGNDDDRPRRRSRSPSSVNAREQNDEDGSEHHHKRHRTELSREEEK